MAAIQCRARLTVFRRGYGGLNQLARSRLAGFVDTFVGDRTVAANDFDAAAKHDQVHGCGPGPIPFHLLQLALHSAAHFGERPL